MLLILAAMAGGMARSLGVIAEAAPQTPNYMDQGGARWVVGGDLDVPGDLNMSGDLFYTPQSLTVSGATITPTGSLVTLNANAAITITAIAGGAAGKVLVLTNVDTDTIIISETATLHLGGNRSLGQYDSVSLINDGTNWVETGFANN